jgi:hypothetical protein
VLDVVGAEGFEAVVVVVDEFEEGGLGLRCGGGEQTTAKAKEER